jgi:hypothetical protein
MGAVALLLAATFGLAQEITTKNNKIELYSIFLIIIDPRTKVIVLSKL